MGSIYRRGTVYWIKYYKNGKVFRETSRSEKKEIAKRLLKHREGEIAEGKMPGVYFDKVKFDELAEDYLADYLVNGRRTIEKAKRCVRRLGEEFGGMKASDIGTARVNRYIQTRLDEGRANATINRELAALKRMFSLAARCTPPKVAQVPHILMLKEDNTRKGFFEYEEFISLRNTLPDYLKGLVTFAYKTGWRLSEITSLTWSQVDLKHGIVRLEVGETKNKEGRTVYLDEEMREVLQNHWDARKSRNDITPWVFPNKDGKPSVSI